MTRRPVAIPAVLAVLAAAALAAGAQTAPEKEKQAPPKITAVRAGHLLSGGGWADDVVVIIADDRIQTVGPAKQTPVPSGAQVIDLSGAWVLPGLIDCHTHVTMGDPGNYYEKMFRKSPIDYAVAAHVYARRTLEAGFTTIRDVGAGEFVDVALRKAIDSGLVPGPRMQVATLAIGATGSHADLIGFSPYLQFKEFTGIADGADEVRKAVRFRVKNGADFIKVIATGGVLSEEAAAGAPQYTQEELDAAVAEAAMWDKKVAAHAHGAEGIKRAVRAGVASIEHGSLIDDEGIRLMKERGTYLVADIYNDDYILAEFARLQFPEKVLDKERQVGQKQRENFQRAARAGVKIAFGSDAGVYPQGWNAKQFAFMVRWGLTSEQAIQAATADAADLMGWGDRVGRVAPGYFADLIAVTGNPAKDITELERVRFVMRGGAVVKNDVGRGR
jgi:imidazolonepropionase-like amidohydrolase